MKIEVLAIDRNNFMVHEHMIGDHLVHLVQPIHIGADWRLDNMHFRSSVWDSKGYPVSLSFKKFYNWGEKPHLTPVPETLAGAQLMEKIDGSTLIFSRYNGEMVIRTRGTVDARKQENGYEIDYLLSKYPKLVEYFENSTMHNSVYSYVFEWVSPSNKIVIDYGVEPDMYLTAIISHDDYTYQSQQSCDEFAESLSLRRPKSYKYDSVEEMKAAVEAFRGVEGLCVYFHDGQEILKVKSAQYLFLHRAKSDIASVEKVVDLYFNQFDIVGHFPTYEEFYGYLEKAYDFEIAEMARGSVSKIADAIKEVQKILDGFETFIAPYRRLTRKQAATMILQAYGQSGRTSMLFKMYDNKSLTIDDLKKLLYQVMKE